MIADKWKHFSDWYIRRPDGTALNLNTEEAADYVLSLIERAQVLEARAKKQQRARSRKKEIPEDEVE